VTQAPYTFAEARQAAENASRLQKAAEDFIRQAARESARAEERYRVALAEEIVEQHAAGVAWSSAPDLARGNKRVAELRRQRDIAEGVREAAMQAAWRRAADRKDTQRFIDWSMRRELAEGYGQVPEPDEQPVIGRRAA
jgi:hypothetical protein